MPPMVLHTWQTIRRALNESGTGDPLASVEFWDHTGSPRNTRNLISGIFIQAVEDGRIAVNPAQRPAKSRKRHRPRIGGLGGIRVHEVPSSPPSAPLSLCQRTAPWRLIAQSPAGGAFVCRKSGADCRGGGGGFSWRSARAVGYNEATTCGRAGSRVETCLTS